MRQWLYYPFLSSRGSGQHRLKLIYMAQIEERPPCFAIQVNLRARVTRDYAYFIENRLRARYGIDGVPLIIDFVERGTRTSAGVAGRSPAATVSRLRNAPSSWIVLISGAGKTTVAA
jgi:hypothetical protein